MHNKPLTQKEKIYWLTSLEWATCIIYAYSITNKYQISISKMVYILFYIFWLTIKSCALHSPLQCKMVIFQSLTYSIVLIETYFKNIETNQHKQYRTSHIPLNSWCMKFSSRETSRYMSRYDSSRAMKQLATCHVMTVHRPWNTLITVTSRQFKSYKTPCYVSCLYSNSNTNSVHDKQQNNFSVGIYQHQ